MTAKPNDDFSIITVKIDRNTAKTFANIAKENNRNKSILIRDWINQYIAKNGQGKLDF